MTHGSYVQVTDNNPPQKCRGFSVSYSEVTAIARIKSLFRASVVPADNTYRRYPQAPIVYIDGGGQGAETMTETVIRLPTVRLIDQSLDSVEFAEGAIITSKFKGNQFK